MRVKQRSQPYHNELDTFHCNDASRRIRKQLPSMFMAVNPGEIRCGDGLTARRSELERTRAEIRMKLLYVEALRRAAEEEQNELMELEQRCKILVDKSNSCLVNRRPRITLPVEIIIQILSYLWPPSKDDCTRPLGVRPTEVAIAPSPGIGWKSAIEHFGSWSRTRYLTTRSTKPASLRETLMRSAPSRLDVHLGDMYPGTDAFLAVAAEFRDRWDTLSINAAYWNRQGASFEQLQRLGIMLSRVRNLIIYPHDYCYVSSEWISTWCGTPSQLGSEETPRLRTANLPASCLPSFTHLFGRLHSLTLHISQLVNGGSRRAFLGLKMLTRLSLKDCSYAREFFTDSRKSGPVVLPYLEELELDNIDSNAIPVAASSLSCRRLQKLKIGKIRFPNFNSAERTMDVYQALLKGLSASYPTVVILDLRVWPNTVLYELLKNPMTREGHLPFPSLNHLMWDMSESGGIGVSGEMKRLFSLAEVRHASAACADLRVLEVDVSSQLQRIEHAAQFQAAQFYGLDLIINAKMNN